MARFEHLLQPIRDLALNWDIDVASELEQYLDEAIKQFVQSQGNQAG